LAESFLGLLTYFLPKNMSITPRSIEQKQHTTRIAIKVMTKLKHVR
jgi:hypothetical protein